MNEHDVLQPTLLAVSLLSTIGFAISARGAAAQIPAVLSAVGLVVVLVGSVVWLVPLQRRLVASGAELQTPDVERLRRQWLSGHLIRTGVSLAALALAAVAAMV